MENRREGSSEFLELSALIESYAGGGREAMALKIIGGVYLPSPESRSLGDAKGVVDGILERHRYYVEQGEGGGLNPQSVYAVLNVARHGGSEEDLKWGASRLFRILEALGKRASDGVDHPKRAADATLVSTSLAQLARATRTQISSMSSMN